MKISCNWLKHYLDTGLEPEAMAAYLTDCGLEVESLEPASAVKGGLKGLVVGEVKTCARHPNADRLTLTTVDAGTGTDLAIVCGAPNVAPGQKVIVALPGTTLYPVSGEPFVIKKSKIRGEASEGMLCAEDEIGLGPSHDGILVLPAEAVTGMAAADYFGIEEDVILEIGLTPNRADAASHLGVARDLLAVLAARNPVDSLALQVPSVAAFAPDDNSFPVDVRIDAPEACIRYTGVTLSGVCVGESPAWLQQRLRSIGIGPINNIVDITNFVLHECGQPLHAFDADRIDGRKVVVRTARAGEPFTTLDHVQRTLDAGDLMICSEREAMCIAGVFGGLHSGITGSTTNVFLESACFLPASIRKTSKRHGLKTDASFRFERGTDPELTVYALQRAALLIREIAGGRIASAMSDWYPKPVSRARVTLDYAYLDRLAGYTIDRDLLRNIIRHLDLSVAEERSGALVLDIPTRKTDVTRPVDVVEEILRIAGFNSIPVPDSLRSSITHSESRDPEVVRDAAADYLAANGFFEILTNSLTKSRYYSEPENGHARVGILNPLSQDLDTLRQNLLFSALEAVEYNRNRQRPDLKFFEFGKTYFKSDNGYRENNSLCLLVTGKKSDPSWTGAPGEAGFFYLKGFLRNLLERTGLPSASLSVTELESHPLYAAGLRVTFRNRDVAEIGSVRTALLKSFDISQGVFAATVDWDAVLDLLPESAVTYRELPKFPMVRRDLSMVIGRDIRFTQIEKIAFATEKKLLQEVQLFDVYEGEKIGAGKKSYAMSFVLVDETQTLTDQQIDKTMNRLMDAFEKQAGAVIRKQ